MEPQVSLKKKKKKKPEQRGRCPLPDATAHKQPWQWPQIEFCQLNRPSWHRFPTLPPPPATTTHKYCRAYFVQTTGPFQSYLAQPCPFPVCLTLSLVAHSSLKPLVFASSECPLEPCCSQCVCCLGTAYTGPYYSFRRLPPVSLHAIESKMTCLFIW